MPGVRALAAGVAAFATGMVAAATLWVQVGHVGDLGARLPPPPQDNSCPAPSTGEGPTDLGPTAQPGDL